MYITRPRFLAFCVAAGLCFVAFSESYASSKLAESYEPQPILLAQKLAQRQASQTTLIVNSPVRQARVSVDGIIAGGVNQTILISPGVRMIRVFHKDFHPYTQKLRVVSGRTHRMRVTLRRKPSPQELQKQNQRRKPPVQAVAPVPAPMLAPSPVNQAVPPPPPQPQPPASVRPQWQYGSRAMNTTVQPQNPPLQYTQTPMAPQQQRGVQHSATPTTQPPPTYGYPPPSTYAPRQNVRRVKPPPPQQKLRKKPSKSKSVKPLPMFKEPEPRETSDYVMSFLPLGLPQMRNDKPILGAGLLLLQAGGVGGYFWFDYSTKQAKADYDVELKVAKTTTQKSKQKWEPYINQQNLIKWICLGTGIAGYVFSVLEDLVVGPKPKTAADMFSYKGMDDGGYMSLSQDVSQPLCDPSDPYYCLVMLRAQREQGASYKSYMPYGWYNESGHADKDRESFRDSLAWDFAITDHADIVLRVSKSF